MAIVLGNKSTRKIKVTAFEPGDFDEVIEQELTLEIKKVSKAERDAINAASDAGKEDEAGQLIFDAVLSIEGVQDENGTPVTDCKALRAAIVDAGWPKHAIYQGFWAVQGGITQDSLYKAIKLKN